MATTQADLAAKKGGVVTIKVVIADDHSLVRQGLRRYLDMAEDIDVVGEASNGEEAIGLVEEAQPDVVLLDIRMPQMDGLTALERIAKRFPKVKVVVLSGVDDHAVVKTAFERGARAYAAKHVDPRDLPSVVRQAHAETVYQPFGVREAEPAPHAELTESQLRVLQCLTQGLSNKQIARELWLSEQTVKFHLSNIYRVLQVSSRSEAIRYAFERALVSNPMLEAAP